MQRQILSRVNALRSFFLSCFSFPRFVAWPLELGLGTRNPRFVAWPLELGLGTRNPRFVFQGATLGLRPLPLLGPCAESVPRSHIRNLACFRQIRIKTCFSEFLESHFLPLLKAAYLGLFYLCLEAPTSSSTPWQDMLRYQDLGTGQPFSSNWDAVFWQLQQWGHWHSKH